MFKRKQRNSCGCESNVCCPHQDSRLSKCKCGEPSYNQCAPNSDCQKCINSPVTILWRGKSSCTSQGWAKNKKWNWVCICCEKEIPFDPNGPGSDAEGLLPNLYGGTMEIHFGYGSKFDQLEDMMSNEDIRIQACICDECFTNKMSLTRKVEIRKTMRYVQISKRD